MEKTNLGDLEKGDILIVKEDKDYDGEYIMKGHVRKAKIGYCQKFVRKDKKVILFTSRLHYTPIKINKDGKYDYLTSFYERAKNAPTT